jgi:DNA-binding transcriptional MerR regulator
LDKAPDAFRTISEVAAEIDVPQHVLRFWESRFSQIRPLKRGGGRRYYRPDDVDLLRGIRHLLYGEGYTIRGVQRILREQGLSFVQGVWRAGAEQPPLEADEADHDKPKQAARAPSREEPSFFELPLPQPGDGRRARQSEPAAAASPPRPHLEGEGRRKLRTVLEELVDCRRVLDAALAGQESASD